MEQIDFIKTLYARVNKEAGARGLEAQVVVAKDGLWIASIRKGGRYQHHECLLWDELASSDREAIFARKFEISMAEAAGAPDL